MKYFFLKATGCLEQEVSSSSQSSCCAHSTFSTKTLLLGGSGTNDPCGASNQTQSESVQDCESINIYMRVDRKGSVWRWIWG